MTSREKTDRIDAIAVLALAGVVICATHPRRTLRMLRGGTWS